MLSYDSGVILTEIDIFPSGKKEVIKKMVIDTNRHALYLGSPTTLTKLSLEQCNRFLRDRSACISAADPYCGWDEKTSSCISILAPGASSELKQDLSTCPKAKEVGWSPWRTCARTDGNLCRCQVRPCQNGQGSSCEGGTGIRMTGIALEKIGANTGVYASTDRGSVMKVSQPSELPQSCLLTEIDIFPSGKKEVIKKMVIDTNRHVLYLGSPATLTKLSLEQWNRFLLDRSACIPAADPYCGWDEKTSSCISILAPGASSELKQDTLMKMLKDHLTSLSRLISFK